jgi:hypothetical protein
MLLLIILIVTSGDGKTATRKQYEAVTLGVGVLSTASVTNRGTR